MVDIATAVRSQTTEVGGELKLCPKNQHPVPGNTLPTGPVSRWTDLDLPYIDGVDKINEQNVQDMQY